MIDIANVCQYCGLIKDDVKWRPDDYNMELHNDPDAEHFACDKCDQIMREEV